MTITYIIFDHRAISDLDSALVLDTADTLKEARKACKAQGGGCIFETADEITENHFVEYIE